MSDHIVIIGAGPGGTAAAIEAARHDAQVTLIERDHVGGTCLNRGCIPTKTILSTAKCLDAISQSDSLNIAVDAPPRLDLTGLRARTTHIVANLRGQLETQLMRAKIDLVRGEASITDGGLVLVRLEDGTERELRPDALIIASGSVPFALPFIDHSLVRVWTSDEALELREIPNRMIIIGAGVIGVELATAYAAFGTQVTLIDVADQILPFSDKRSARTVAAALKGAGIDIRVKTTVTEVTEIDGGIQVTLESGEVLTADIVLSAVGRKPLLPAGFEEGDTLPYPCQVIGDASGGIMLAHAADAEGKAAARALVGRSNTCAEVNESSIPACVYTHPEVASIGLSVDDAKKSGRNVVSGVAKYAGNGKALAENHLVGFATIVADKPSGKIVGSQIVGPDAVELIAQVALMMKAEMTVIDIDEVVYAHPTISEVVKDACALARMSL